MMQALQTRQRLVNPFFHNQIKRRIAMITNSSRSSYQYLRKIMVLPVACLIVSVVAINCTSKDLKDVTKSDKHSQKPTPVEEKMVDLQLIKKLGKDSLVRDYVIKELKEKIVAVEGDKNALDNT